MISSDIYIISSGTIFSSAISGTFGCRFFVCFQELVAQLFDLFPVFHGENPESGHDAAPEGLRLVSQDVGSPLHKIVFRIHFDEHVTRSGVEPFRIDIELQANKRLNRVYWVIPSYFIVGNCISFYANSVCKFLLSQVEGFSELSDSVFQIVHLLKERCTLMILPFCAFVNKISGNPLTKSRNQHILVTDAQVFLIYFLPVQLEIQRMHASAHLLCA